MQIEIVTERQPWVNGRAHDFGEIVECSDEDGAAMIAAGHAIIVAESQDEPKRRVGRPRKDAQ